MSFEKLIGDLHEAVGASRTTLRLDTPGDVFPVVAESVAPGIHSIKGATTIDLRGAATFQFLAREKTHLIQDDCASAPDAPPPDLLALYGVKAQMLAPILRDGELVGILSVHYAPAVRRWTPAEVALLDDAARAITAELATEPS